MWIFWILVIVALFFVIKAMAGNEGSNMTGGARPVDETPLEILKKRYARGEIDEQEFIQRRKELEK